MKSMIILSNLRNYLCEKVKEISKFSRHLYNKDGYVNNFYDCCQEVTNKARKTDKDKGIRYKCNNCEKDYARKDVLSLL